MVKQKLISQKEDYLKEIAKKAWIKTLKEFYYPPLDEPEFIFDYSHKEGFYINPENRWKITMNLANTPLLLEDQDFLNYYFAVTLHEVSHYQIIPYDGYINAKLLRAAMKHVNQNFAPIVVNIFADLHIDILLHKKYPNLMNWELQTTYNHIKQKHQISDFTEFLLRIYEKVLNIQIFEKPDSRWNDLTKKVSKIVLDDFYDDTTWEKKVSKIAYYFRDLINNTFSLMGKYVKSRKGTSKRKSPAQGSQFIEIPDDILELMDNPLENRNKDKLQKDNGDSLRQKAEQFAKDIPYSEFGAPANQAGILIDAEPLATWYRGKAKNLIEIKILEEKPGGEVPAYPEVWRIGDPIEELDIVQSLLNSPIIIPNVTTRKWISKEGPGILKEKSLPDLLIVLDSSGSMGWNYTATTNSARGKYHTALIASFAALHYVAKKGVKFSVINFSNKADICPWTVDYTKAEKKLLRYQGGGTHLPLKQIKIQCDKADQNVLIFLITDFGIYNWTKSKNLFSDLINQGQKIVGFFIGTKSVPKNKFKDLQDKMTFYPIQKAGDLINLIIEEVKRYYL
jgi:hypothetical protein